MRLLKSLAFVGFLFAVQTDGAQYECKPAPPDASQELFEVMANALQPGDELIIRAGARIRL